MTNTIHTSSFVPTALPAGGKRSSDATGDSTAASSSAGAPQGDSVRLTASAQALGQASRLDRSEASGVDGAHVERIRQALANGDYHVDAGRIADKLVSFETQVDSVR